METIHPVAWHALVVKPRHEHKVVAALESVSAEGFLPTFQDKRRWSDRVKIIDVPLFPGYVFARFDYEATRVPIMKIGGVRSIVGSGGSADRIPEEEISSIRTMVTSGFPLQPFPFLLPGTRVKVEHGPLKGAEGVVIQQKDAWMMVVGIEILNRSVAVPLDRSTLKALKPEAVHK